MGNSGGVGSFALIVPCYNERENIRALLDSARLVSPSISEDYQIIVVDDGSTDGTAELARSIASEDPRIVVISQPHAGYGAALSAGLERSRNVTWVALVDADQQFDLRDLTQLISKSRGVDVVLGYRERRADSFVRHILQRMLKIWNRLLFGFPQHIVDVNCAMKLFSRSAIQLILPLESRGAMVSTEMIYKVYSAGFRITQLPVSHFKRVHGEQTGARLSTIARAIVESWRLRKILTAWSKQGPQTVSLHEYS